MKLALAALLIAASAMPADAKPGSIHLVLVMLKNKSVTVKNIEKNMFLEPVKTLDM